jgi:hypothetical protein
MKADTKGVISRTRGAYTSLAHRGIQAQQEIQRPTLLEGTGSKLIIPFNSDVFAERF